MKKNIKGDNELEKTHKNSIKINSIDLLYSMVIAILIIFICTRFNKYFFFFDDSQNLILPYLKQSGELWLKGEIPFLLDKTFLGQNNILEVDRGIFLPQNILLSILAAKVHSFNSLARISAFINLTLLSFFAQKVADALKINNVYKRVMAFLFCINPMVLYIYLPSWWTLITGQAWFVALLASILFLRNKFSLKYMICYVVSTISIFLNSFPNYVIGYLVVIFVFMLELLIDKKYKKLIYFIFISFFIALIVINVYSEFIISSNLFIREKAFDNLDNFSVVSFNFIFMSFNPIYFDFISTYGGYIIIFISLGYSSIYMLFVILFKENLSKIFKSRTTKFLVILIVIFFILTQMPRNFSFLRQPWRFLPFLSELIAIFSMYILSIDELKINKNRIILFILVILISFILSIFRLEKISVQMLILNFIFVMISLIYVYLIYKNKKIDVSLSMIYTILMLFLMLFSKGSVDGFLPFPGVQDSIYMKNNFSGNGYILSLTNGKEKKENIEDLHSSHFGLYGLKSINGYSPLGHKKIQKKIDIISAHGWINPENTINKLAEKYNNVCYFDLFNITSIPIWYSQLTSDMKNKLESCGFSEQKIENPEGVYFIRNKNIIGNISYTSDEIKVDKVLKEKNNKEVYRITSKQSGEIILSKPYWRGYTAKINGKKVIITDEAGLLKLEIPGNINNGILELTYFPRSWRFTLWLALVGIIGIILMLIDLKNRDKNNN